jgi:hypothetical protein
MVDVRDDGDVSDFHDTRINKSSCGIAGLIDGSPAAEQQGLVRLLYSFVGFNRFCQPFRHVAAFRGRLFATLLRGFCPITTANKARNGNGPVICRSGWKQQSIDGTNPIRRGTADCRCIL